VVVEHPQRRRGSHCVPVQVGEHLLAAIQSSIQEEHNGDGFVAKGRSSLKRQLDGTSPMLSVVDDEPSRHRNTQQPQSTAFAGTGKLLKLDLGVD